MATGGITFNGTTGQFLEWAGSLSLSYPYSVSAWVASSVALGVSEEFIAGLGSTTQDAIAGAVYSSNGNNNKTAYDRSTATGTVPGTKSSSPHFSTTLQLMVVRFTSSTSREVAFGDNTFAGDTSTSITQNFSHFDTFTIGAARRSSGVLLPAQCTIAEVHIYNTALTGANFTTLLTTKPDGGGIASWVDGWALASNSDLTSIGGTRTLTATGSPTTASLTLPYTRASAPVLTSPTGAATGNTTGTAGFTTNQAVSGALPAYFLVLPSATAAPADAAALIANGATVSQTTGGTTPTRPLTALTTNTAVRVHMCQPGSNVVSSAPFTPPTMASSGSLAAQSGTTSGAFTFAGATPESQITQQGVGSSSWALTNAGGSGLTTINSATGVPGGTLTATPGTYSVTLTKTDSSTAGTNPTGGGSPPQTIVRTMSVTVAAGTLYGFRFASTAGLEFGNIVGALTGLGLRPAAEQWVATAHDVANHSTIVAQSPTLVMGSGGRLPNWSNASIANATNYFVSFRRVSDNWTCSAVLTAELVP